MDLPPSGNVSSDDGAEDAVQKPESRRESEDRNCIRRVRAGDTAALEELFRRYHAPMRHFAANQVGSPDTGADLVQNVFARMWRQRETLDVRGSVRGYLFSAVRFEAISFRRRERTAKRHLEAWQEEGATPAAASAPPPPDVAAEQAALRSMIRAAVAGLPERCRLIIDMRWRYQLSHAEIAHTLGISTKTVENQVTIGFRALRRVLASVRDV